MEAPQHDVTLAEAVKASKSLLKTFKAFAVVGEWLEHFQDIENHANELYARRDQAIVDMEQAEEDCSKAKARLAKAEDAVVSAETEASEVRSSAIESADEKRAEANAEYERIVSAARQALATLQNEIATEKKNREAYLAEKKRELREINAQIETRQSALDALKQRIGEES